MTSALLEVTDQSIRLIRDGELLEVEPCYATLDGEWIFGEAAKAMQRLKPRESQANYLAQLSTESLARPIGNLRHHADLAYLQLKALHERHQHQYSQLFMIPPPHYEVTQLSLLLGVAETAGLPISGLVEAGLLESSSYPPPSGELLYLDLGRHCVTARKYTADRQGALALTTRETISDRGLHQMVEGLMQEAQMALIAAERFDPMRRAETEQQLFQGALAWLERGVPGTGDFTLTHEDRIRRVSITEPMLRAATGRMMSQVIEAVRGSDVTVLASHRLHQVPFVVEQLSLAIGSKIEALPQSGLADAFNRHLGQLIDAPGEPGQRIITLQPSQGSAPPIDQPLDEENSPLATHLLECGVATPLDPLPTPCPPHWSALELINGSTGTQLAPAAEVQVNGKSLSAPKRLRAGDEITIGDVKIMAIHVTH